MNAPPAAARAADSIAFTSRLMGDEWPPGYPQALSQADLPWLGEYLAGCGFAGGLLAPALQTEWRPHTSAAFAGGLERRARADALRELSHREALNHLHAALAELQCRAILLKGAALYLQEEAAGITPHRVPGDLDILIEDPQLAVTLRQALMKNGFTGDPDALRTGPHHLAPVWRRGTTVEIHTAIMPEFWRLPEAEMLRRTIPVSGWTHYHTLSLEDMVLHEAIHSTTHLWSFGLKLARDLQRIAALAGRHSMRVQWDSIASDAAGSAAPLAFWAPLGALHRSLVDAVSPLPPEFLALAPAGRRLDNAIHTAARRAFTATDDAAALNPFVRNGIFLRLMDWRSRSGYVRQWLGASAAESRRAALGSAGATSWKHLPAQLFEALRPDRKNRP